MDPPNTSMWRDDPRLFGEFPSDNLSSAPSCDQRPQQAAATTKPVSYTHLDVYKRQGHHRGILAVQSVTYRSRRCRGLEAFLDRIGEVGRAIENHP